MKVKFSRHAKRRAKLYNISELEITNILSNMNLHQGDHEIVKNIAGVKYPVKIVVSVKGDAVMVITSYPLKKRRKK